MSAHSKSRLIVAIAMLLLSALACNRSIPTATPAPALPTLAPPTPSPSRVAPPATETPTASPSQTPLPPTETPIPPPPPTATPVIPLVCPPPGDPTPPDRPAVFGDYAETLAAYLSAGGSTQGLERLLRDWGAITDEQGEVRSLDITGDMNPETVIAIIDPAPEFDLPWPSGDVLIFQCQEGAVVTAYQGRDVIDQELIDLWFSLHKVEDVNGTGRADAVYSTSSCGAHTCWDRLYVIEWDGAGFVNRAPSMDEYPYATFTVENGQILVDVGGIGSAGAGYQRGYREVWAWDGRQYVVVQQIVGPPTALIHTIHDGDDALAQGDFGGAIGHYQAVFENTDLPPGLFLEEEEWSAITVKAYARFKLVVAYAASGDGRGAQAQYDLLIAEHPDGSYAFAFALMGQAFWGDLLANNAPGLACAAAVALVESDPLLTDRLYAGYANPDYGPADLCRLAE